MKNRTFVFVAFVLLVVAGFFFFGPTRTRSAEPSVIVFSNELPTAFDKWEVVTADSIVVLIDATTDGVMGEIPEVALTGKTVKVTCKESRFMVSPTRRGSYNYSILHMAGEVVELTDDGPYSIVLVSSGNQPRATAVSYIVKMSQAELDELTKDLDKLSKPPKQEPAPSNPI